MIKNIILILSLLANIITGNLLWNLIDGYNPDCSETTSYTVHMAPVATKIIFNKRLL